MVEMQKPDLPVLYKEPLPKRVASAIFATRELEKPDLPVVRKKRLPSKAISAAFSVGEDIVDAVAADTFDAARRELVPIGISVGASIAFAALMMNLGLLSLN